MNQIQELRQREDRGLYQVAPEPEITSPKGFSAAGVHCGMKRRRNDIGLIFCDVPASTAAVYTMNGFQAAPLQVTRQGLAVEGRMQALLCNSAIANACTGEKGLEDALEMRKKTADSLGLSEHLVGVASTGVIGEFLPMERINRAIPALTGGLSAEGCGDFSQSILTTDTFTKNAAVVLTVEGKEVRIAGTAKGSGMVHPRMATMLAFLTTDAVIAPESLQELLHEVTDETFNMITVDGDCSTNDMVSVMASGKAGHSPLTPNHPDWPAFRRGFAHVARELAQMIARDGEGATRLVEVRVTGADTLTEARQAAKAVVGSSLVKTAIYGADPNWGRIICAIGYSGAAVDPSTIDIFIGETGVVQKGRVAAFDEEEARSCLQREKVLLTVDLNRGNHEATAWGCDLTYDYVRINASYRT
ncbi:bifunctional glutamate N-acetyltransferase/amino-acid acetyltransferase ArgJ [Paludifilum halophilum]|uniref:Arginine biosynthesis bifunctional protein ArgJ n=1 Tax=Paludifilum halophilum TaxID=1642702 RepID=A0A235B6Y9_9BACL|nr:bifunctional glutamate N-acetyltransferase/amino-acid acetyltransferase ArgJ [Paludifilum halophilum]OYD08073.1 bifunctional ornithine acetyltransferase/N-acetylglutamate synthase [Paludifilum halophilum]